MGKRFFLLFVSPILVVTLFVFYDQTIAREGAFEDDRSLAQVRSLILSQYVEEVEEENLLDGALRGMVQTLDPHSAYLDAQASASMKEEMEGEFGGIGVEITVEGGWVTVITPIDGTPAHEAGILAGDRIIAVDGRSTEGMDTQDVARLVKGKPGTRVTITVYTPEEDTTRDVTLVRSVIQVKSVKHAGFIDREAGIGYLAVVHFQQRTAEEVEAAIEKLRAEGMKSLVMDLRNNPGGLLDQSIMIADLFLDSGVIVSTRGRIPDANREELANAEGTFPAFPLALLVNQGSASASEVLAGALQDHRRAVLVGTRTYGKGSVQTVYELAGGKRALKLTTARYYTPSGRSIHRTDDEVGGIVPDVIVQLSADERREMLRHQREEKGASGLPWVDPQLQRALDVLKGVQVYRSLEDVGGGDR